MAYQELKAVADALRGRRWVHIKAGLSVQTLLDYLRVWDLPAGLRQNAQPDIFRWKWDSSGQYTPLPRLTKYSSLV
jgi:hypothetical protein